MMKSSYFELMWWVGLENPPHAQRWHFTDGDDQSMAKAKQQMMARIVITRIVEPRTIFEGKVVHITREYLEWVNEPMRTHTET